jgi:hypothetical protein
MLSAGELVYSLATALNQNDQQNYSNNSRDDPDDH